ncbi:hypothetical protein JCM5353_008853 [Sporobolomyces roseus]
MLSRWKTALGQTLMGTPVSSSQSSEPSTSPSANFDRAMPQVQELETPLLSTHSTIAPPSTNGASAVNNSVAPTDQQEVLTKNDDGNQSVDAVPNAQSRQQLGNLFSTPNQAVQLSTSLAQDYNIVTSGSHNQDRTIHVGTASGSNQVMQGPSFNTPIVTSQSANSIPAPIAIVHRLEDGSTFSFAVGTKYRGRHAFQVPAHRIFFDNGYGLVTDRLHTNHYQKEPSKSDYPVSGTFELRCIHYQCPCYIKLQFQLHRFQVPTNEIEFEMVEFVNEHAFHFKGEGVPRAYKPPCIKQEYVKVRVAAAKLTRRSIGSESDSESPKSFTSNNKIDAAYRPNLSRISTKPSLYPSNTSVGYQVAHRPEPSLFPCSKASLEILRRRLKAEVGANVAPSGGNPTAIRVRWVCHVGRGGRSQPGGSRCPWKLAFTSQRDAERWGISDSESYTFHNHPIPEPYGPTVAAPKPLTNTAFGGFTMPPMLDGRILPPLQPLSVSRMLAQADVDEKPSDQLRIEASHRYQERNAPSSEAIVRPAPPVLYESQQSIDSRSSSKHVRSESFEGGDDASPFKSPRYSSLAPTPIERNASLDFDPYAYLHDDYRESQPIPRMETNQGSSSIDSLETFLYNLAPTFTFRLLETRTQHNLTLLAPSFVALDYTHPESIQDLELRDLDDLMIELRQHFDQHQKGDSGGIGLHDWKRIANRLQAALRS